VFHDIKEDDIMRRFRTLGFASLIATTSLLTGCFDDDSSNSGTVEDDQDESAIEESLNLDIAEYADPDVFLYGDDADGGPTTRSEINTIRWWRELIDVDKTIKVVITRNNGPPVADVSITYDVTGLLHLIPGEASTQSEFVKDFQNRAARSLYFERQGPPRQHPHRGWKLKALSGALIASPGTTRNINSVRVQVGTIDETITNVTDLVRLENILRLPPNSEVNVTVDTGDATDSVYLHVRSHHLRFALANNGDGTHTGVYRTGEGRGPRHAVIDVLSNGTLFDDSAPYDNMAWGIPYVIRGEDDGISGNGL
jgi:hypothetical protein